MADMNVCLRQEPVSPNLTRVLLSPSGSHYSPLPPRLEPRLPRAKRYLNARIWPMSGCIDAVGRNEVCRGLMPRCNAGAGLGNPSQARCQLRAEGQALAGAHCGQGSRDREIAVSQVPALF
jgi:hypothetical protein